MSFWDKKRLSLIVLVTGLVACTDQIPQSIPAGSTSSGSTSSTGSTGGTGAIGGTGGIPTGGSTTSITITSNLAAKTISAGQNLSTGDFCVSASGSSLSYQWYKNASPVAGSTSSCFLLTNAQVSDSGYYFVRITSNGNAATAVSSNTVQLTVQAGGTPSVQPATITQDLTPRNLTVGQNLSGFCVTATGTNLTYQWFKNSAVLAGETAACFNKSNVQTSDSGQYYVRLTTSNSGVTAIKDSATVTITVSTPTVAQAVISSDLADKTVTAGTELTGFCVAATGTNLTYQWYKNGSVISGEINACFNKLSVQTSDSGQYYVKLSTTNGTSTATVNSRTATLTVNAVPDNVKVVGATTFEGCGPYCGYSPYEGDYIITATLSVKTNAITAQVAHICRYPWKCGSDLGIFESAPISFTLGTFDSAAFNTVNGGDANFVIFDGDCMKLYEGGTVKSQSCFSSATAYPKAGEVPPVIVKGIGTSDGSSLVWNTYSDPSPVPGGSLCAMATGTNLRYEWYLNGVKEGGQDQRCFKSTTNFQNGTTWYFDGEIKVRVINGAGQSAESATHATLMYQNPDPCGGGCGA